MTTTPKQPKTPRTPETPAPKSTTPRKRTSSGEKRTSSEEKRTSSGEKPQKPAPRRRAKKIDLPQLDLAATQLVDLAETQIDPVGTQQVFEAGEKPHRLVVHPLRVKRVPMRHGWYWLIEGFTLWIRAPAFLSFIAFVFMIAILGASLIDYVGDLIGGILSAGLGLGLFNGCRAIDRKRRLSPALLFSGFRRRPYDLLLAGFCNFIAERLLLLYIQTIDKEGAFWQLAEYGRVPEMTTTLLNPYGMATIAIFCLVWGMAYVFVPTLIGWWRLPVHRALLFSFKGCLRNFFPFLAYIFCFGVFVCTLPALVINFSSLTMEGVGIIVCAIYLLVIFPVLFASIYVAARDIFGFPRRRKHRHRTKTSVSQEPEKPAR